MLIALTADLCRSLRHVLVLSGWARLIGCGHGRRDLAGSRMPLTCCGALGPRLNDLPRTQHLSQHSAACLA